MAEARRSTKKELFNVSMHAWNAPSADEPLYAIERNVATRQWLIYVSDLTAVPTGATANNVTVWYVAAINDIEDTSQTGGAVYQTDTEQVLPADVEELVLNYAVLSCLQELSMPVATQTINVEIKRLQALYKQRYAVEKQKVGSLLPSKQGVN